MDNLEGLPMHSDILLQCLTRLKSVYNTYTEEIFKKRPNGFIILMDNDLKFRIRIAKEAEYVYTLYINNGVTKFIYEYCKIMLSDNNNFINHGQSSHIIHIPSTRYVERDFDVLDIALSNCENYELVTFDEQRSKFLKYLFECCLQFIVTHEYTHFYNGHLDFLFTIKKINEYVEGELSLNVNPLDHQTLEMDADSKATVFLYDLVTNKYNFKPEYKLVLENEDIEEIIYFVGFVCLLIFRFTCLKVVDSIKEMKINSHPSGSQRLFYATNIIHQKVNLDGYNYTIEQVGLILSKVVIDFEKSISRITYENPTLDFYAFSNDNEILDYGNEIINNWSNLYPIMKNMAYGPIVEPKSNNELKK